MSYIVINYIKIYDQTSNLISGLIYHEDNEQSNNKFASIYFFFVSSQKELNRKKCELRPFKYAIVCRCRYGIGCKVDTESFLNWKINSEARKILRSFHQIVLSPRCYSVRTFKLGFKKYIIVETEVNILWKKTSEDRLWIYSSLTNRQHNKIFLQKENT